MRFLSQSTARNVMVFLTAASDHVTGLAGASGSMVINASKDGAAFAAITPAITDRGSGWYSLALTTSHTDTVGDLALNITATSADPIDLMLNVQLSLPAATLSIATSAITAASIASSAITNAKFAAGAIDAAAIANGAIDLATLAGDVIPAVADATWDEARAGHVAAGSFGEYTPANVTTWRGSTPAILSSSYVQGSVAAMQTDVLNSNALGSTAATEIAAAVWAFVYEGASTVTGFLRLARAILINKGNNLEGSTPAFRDIADSKNRVAWTMSGGAGGNVRSVVTDET